MFSTGWTQQPMLFSWLWTRSPTEIFRPKQIPPHLFGNLNNILEKYLVNHIKLLNNTGTYDFTWPKYQGGFGPPNPPCENVRDFFIFHGGFCQTQVT